MRTISKLLFRLIAIGALAFSAITFGSPNAQAAIRAFPANGGTCVGSQVLRCLELRFDDATEYMVARAEITDPAGGSSVDVKVKQVCIHGVGCSGPTAREGYKAGLSSPTGWCVQGTIMKVDFSASFEWWDVGTGFHGQELRTGQANFTCT
ncbi:hypothetical protein AB0L44_26195 [Nonomuraea wenchangensis]|uniref:hypothetical protein n=1 Tax=Nonomuraea wenchangensis TaxID=568860 RepID=UPI003448C12C